MSRVLLVGEQSNSIGLEVKGFDCFNSNAYKEDGGVLVKALEKGGHEVAWMRTCHAATDFPESLADLRRYDVVILSDVGACTLLFHPEMLIKSIPHPNRLKLLREYVQRGGGVAMVGGWMSFSGIDGKAKYFDSFLEEALPVVCLPYDDRQERPEGVKPTILQKDHHILKNIPSKWPFFLGYNKVKSRPEATEILRLDNDPLLSVWEYGKGRSAAFTTDCAPHWGPVSWLKWSGYGTFWNNLVGWLARS